MIKTFVKIMVMTLLIAFSHILCAQTNTLTGSWKVDLNKTIQRMSNSEKVKYDSLPGRSKATMQDAFDDKKFQFDSDSHVTVTTVMNGTSRQATGQWAYEVSSRKLSITVGQRINEYTVEWDAPNNIHLIYLQQDANAILKQLCLKRIN